MSKFILPRVLVGLTVFTSVGFAQGSVTISNISYPWTALEVNDWVQVSITGAAAYGQVSIAQNGGPQYVYGTTDGSGSWSVTAQETSANAPNPSNIYTQTWYVNGTQVNPSNPYSYINTGPQFPTFYVYQRSSPQQPGTLVGSVDSCGQPSNVTPVWVWTPVTVYPDTSYGSSVVSTATSACNSAQHLISFDVGSAEIDEEIYDTSSLPVTILGQAGLYLMPCNAYCYGYINECNGACDGSKALTLAYIALNDFVISASASDTGNSPDTFAQYVMEHELGHTLALADVAEGNGACSQSGTVMNQAFAFLCGGFGPTSLDVSALSGPYPSSPGYCTPGTNYCESTSCL